MAFEILSIAFMFIGAIFLLAGSIGLIRLKDKKPLSYLKEKYRGKPEAVMELAKRCPWGRGLSNMEIEIVSKWLAGKE